MLDATRKLAALPHVDEIVNQLDTEVASHGHRRVTTTACAVIDQARNAIRAGQPCPEPHVLHERVRDQLAAQDAATLHRVVNATGVVLHTNLGRAPLSSAARTAAQAAGGYSSLEYDLTTGSRGSRTKHVGEIAAQLCGTEAATVVNNGTAGLVLALTALAGGREVIVSRGELVEIGGSCRLPDLIAAAGVRLVEVGTTNSTRLTDYRNAISDDTAMLLKVNCANYQFGSTEDTSVAALAGLGREHGLPVVHDLGSGLLRSADEGPLADEPSVSASVDAGAGLVIVSGDKLLGGPQAGIVAGRSDLIARMSGHPFARAMRVDKLQRAALEATFSAYLRADVPLDVPTLAMLHLDVDMLRDRADSLAATLRARASQRGFEVRPTSSVVGSGTLPGIELGSWAVAVRSDEPTILAAKLRAAATPVIGRTDADAVLLDMRTVPATQDADLADLVIDACT